LVDELVMFRLSAGCGDKSPAVLITAVNAIPSINTATMEKILLIPPNTSEFRQILNLILSSQMS